MTKMQKVEHVLRVGSWILLTTSTIVLLVVGFGNGITPAKFFGILNCILFSVGGIFLIANWLKGQ